MKTARKRARPELESQVPPKEWEEAGLDQSFEHASEGYIADCFTDRALRARHEAPPSEMLRDGRDIAPIVVDIENERFFLALPGHTASLHDVGRGPENYRELARAIEHNLGLALDDAARTRWSFAARRDWAAAIGNRQIWRYGIMLRALDNLAAKGGIARPRLPSVPDAPVAANDAAPAEIVDAGPPETGEATATDIPGAFEAEEVEAEPVLVEAFAPDAPAFDIGTELYDDRRVIVVRIAGNELRSSPMTADQIEAAMPECRDAAARLARCFAPAA